jgi:excisionase family DNA binding protein
VVSFATSGLPPAEIGGGATGAIAPNTTLFATAAYQHNVDGNHQFAWTSPMSNRPVGEPYISTKEASVRSGLSITHLGNLARAGRLDARRMGNRWLIAEQAVDALVFNRQSRPKRGRPRKKG